MGSIFKPKAPEVAPPPVAAPDQTGQERRAELAADALRMRRGRAGNVYAGEQSTQAQSVAKLLLGQ